jgi:hypothetical protein
MTTFDHTCAVSRCDLPTQDRICGLCAAQLATSVLRVARAEHHQEGLWADLEVTLTRQDVMPKAPRSGTNGGSPMGFSVRASDAKAQLEAAVWYWVYLFADANSHLDFDPFTATVPEACAWIAQFPGLIAQLPNAESMWSDLTTAVTAAVNAVDTPGPRSLVGECGEPTVDDKTGEPKICDAGLFALEDARLATCTTCRAVHSVKDRRQRLVAQMLLKTGTATEVARGFGAFGIQVSVNSIRTWGRAKNPDRRLYPVDTNKAGAPIYRFGDVAKRAGLTLGNETNTEVDLPKAA